MRVLAATLALIAVAACGQRSGDPVAAAIAADLARELGEPIASVRCRDRAELLALVATLHGHLTATVHGDGDDFAAFREQWSAAVAWRNGGSCLNPGPRVIIESN